MTESSEAAAALVYDYIELWNERKQGRIPELVSDSFVMVSPKTPPGEARGRRV